jgi:exonuclease V gamma subunit
MFSAGIGWQAVMDLLKQKEVYQCFGLNETDLELISHWVAETHIRTLGSDSSVCNN